MFEDHGAKAAIVWDKISGHITGLPDDIRPAHIYAVNLIKAMPALTRAALKLPVKKARESREKLEGAAPEPPAGRSCSRARRSTPTSNGPLPTI